MAGGEFVQVFSRAYDGNVFLSEHFRVREFASNCGADHIFIHPDLIDLLEQIRQYFDAPTMINSGYRTAQQNIKCGGASYSKHMYGMAADIQVKGHLPAEVYKVADKMLGDRGGVCLYKTFVHVDVRDKKWRDTKL